MDNIVVRTDLAVEANEEAMNGTGKLRGIRLRESKKSRMGVKVTELQVTNHLGEAAIGRPKGTYLTIEADDITGGDEEYAKEVISTLAGYIFKLLKRMNKNVKPEKLLVIGLGNRNITSDSLGPEVVDNISINISDGEGTGVCTLSPGVMAFVPRKRLRHRSLSATPLRWTKQAALPSCWRRFLLSSLLK